MTRGWEMSEKHAICLGCGEILRFSRDGVNLSDAESHDFCSCEEPIVSEMEEKGNLGEIRRLIDVFQNQGRGLTKADLDAVVDEIHASGDSRPGFVQWNFPNGGLIRFRKDELAVAEEEWKSEDVPGLWRGLPATDEKPIDWTGGEKVAENHAGPFHGEFRVVLRDGSRPDQPKAEEIDTIAESQWPMSEETFLRSWLPSKDPDFPICWQACVDCGHIFWQQNTPSFLQAWCSKCARENPIEPKGGVTASELSEEMLKLLPSKERMREVIRDDAPALNLCEKCQKPFDPPLWAANPYFDKTLHQRICPDCLAKRPMIFKRYEKLPPAPSGESSGRPSR